MNDAGDYTCGVDDEYYPTDEELYEEENGLDALEEMEHERSESIRRL